MTVKQFAVKYDIPLGRVKAAMGHRKGGIGTIYEDAIEYEEEKLTETMFDYLIHDFASCLEKQRKIQREMDRIVVRKNKEGAK